MQVKELAKALGITSETVRYYTRLGYLKPNTSLENGYRNFRETDLQRLKFIQSARLLGFSVADIGQILSTADLGESPCALTRTLIEHRLVESEQKIQAMLALRDKMRAAVENWSVQPDREPDGRSICHLIEASDSGCCAVEAVGEREVRS